MPKTHQEEMIEKFQCPGCVCGCDTQCGGYELGEEEGFFSCTQHAPGTMMFRAGQLFLGLPKGFNRVGPRTDERKPSEQIRIWENDTKPDWNKFNVPVWAMVEDDVLYVRTYKPRINVNQIDILPGRNWDALPTNEFTIINVAEFKDEID